MSVAPFRRVAPLFLLALSALARLRGAESDPVADVEKAAADWVKTRAETVRLQTEWSGQRELLESLVSGLQERAQTLETKRDYLQAKTAKAREEIGRLEAANKAAVESMTITEAALHVLDDRLLRLRPTLPPRLSEALELSYRSLAAKELTLSERMQLTTVVLNRCITFNRAITCEEEVLKLGGANGQLAEVIYWGLSHAYALDRTNGNTWYGAPGADGWAWEPMPNGGAQVSRLIAIQRGKAEPTFVLAPARLKNTADQSSAK